ncbi:hypothetical protein P872_09075 [Rhodonellum psychrophilum GCM71 = DSM 17998]|uniref:Transporter n=2 Tax=Rhodonellum TaxID=336827 RepID=U5BX91_9BACT|nr:MULTISPECIES: TolC family protein [Rhodonellum]ERM81236.1 hypothetical protein P872_09075 [Rhodonellum psychrophilum GCM71 = DSM 17998]
MTLQFLLMVSFKGMGQGIEQLDLGKNLEDQLLPLEEIISKTLDFSPKLDYQDALIEKAEYQVELTKRLWQNNVFGFANYSAGDQRIITGDSFNPGGAASTSLVNGYRAGLQVNVPLFEFMGRKSRIKLFEEEKKAVVFQKNEMEFELRRLVTLEYFKLLGAYELLKIRSEGQEALKTNYIIAEKEFKDGIIPIGELSRLTDVLAQSRSYYSDAKFEFLERYHNLAALAGLAPHNLLKNQ